MRIPACAITIVALVLLHSNVDAQESVAAVPLMKTDLTMRGPWLTTLRRLVAAGDVARVGKAATEFVRELDAHFKRIRRSSAADGPARVECCDIRRYYFVVLFGALDPQGRAIVASVLVHDPVPRTNLVPGLEGDKARLYELFLAEDSTVGIQGWYDIDPVEDPAQKQLSDFVSTAIGRLALPDASTLAFTTSGGQPAFAHALTISSVTLPYSRARLTAHHVLAVQRPVAHLGSIAERRAAELRAEAPAADSDDSSPGCGDVIDSASIALKHELQLDACRYAIGEPAECVKKLKAALGDALESARPGDRCTADQARDVVGAFQSDLQVEMFRASGSTAILNQPLQRYSFGIATGYIAAISSDPNRPRVQIQNGKIAVNPFSRSLALGIVNLPLWGYDRTSPAMTMRERLRPFVAMAFAPYFGAAAGFSCAVNRYLAANVGFARLWYDAVKDGERIDQPPVDKSAPFTLAASNAIFVAAAYTFGR
jgi:hypothetical protein